jgi:hypothetical protein
MTERELREALWRAPVEPAARERARRVVQAAFRELPHESRQSRPRAWRIGLVLAGCLAAALVAAAVTRAPTDALARWLRDAVGADAPAPRSALDRLPANGRLLVTAGGSAWVVEPDGVKRRLGSYAGASWSPRGLFVVAWRGTELTALEPDGDVRWSLDAGATMRTARWAPGDGYRIAYVASATLRIVNGDGTGARRFAATRAGVAPAWRPVAAGHVLAWVDARGRVRVTDADARRRLWASGVLRGVRQLAWSTDGGRLLVRTADAAIVLDGDDGRRLGAVAAPVGARTVAAAWAAGGRLVLVLRDRAADRSDLLLADPRNGRWRRVLTLPGRLGAPARSPDGRVLLLPWPDAGQWLFLARADGGRRRVTAVDDVAAQFAPGATPARFPSSAAWAPRR